MCQLHRDAMNPSRLAPRALPLPLLQRGLTLVELMVALAISLTLVLAASMLFLNTRFSQHASDERSQMDETGTQALEIIGRQVGNAGYYPTISEEAGPANGASLKNVFVNYVGVIKLLDAAGTNVAITTGLYGCTTQVVKADLTGCEANGTDFGAPNSDSLTVSYFTADAMSLDVGWRADCTRADIANDSTFNDDTRVGSYTKTTSTGSTAVSRGASSEGLPPAAPMLGINQFLLAPYSYSDDTGRTVSTYALSCRGNGKHMDTVALLPGVEQMTLRYGVAGDADGMPQQYLDAAGVNGLTGNVVVGNQRLSTWGRVVSVRVCVLVRSLNAGAAKVTSGASKDCNGNTISNPDPSAAYQTYTQTFGVKNRLQQSVSL
jgi:type IV pilus assembly protein PilW